MFKGWRNTGKHEQCGTVCIKFYTSFDPITNITLWLIFDFMFSSTGFRNSIENQVNELKNQIESRCSVQWIRPPWSWNKSDQKWKSSGNTGTENLATTQDHVIHLEKNNNKIDLMISSSFFVTVKKYLIVDYFLNNCY